MKIRILLIVLSIITAFTFMSGGYGVWEKKLTIIGNIDVVTPAPLVVPDQEVVPTNAPSDAQIITPENTPESTPVPVGTSETTPVNTPEPTNVQQATPVSEPSDAPASDVQSNTPQANQQNPSVTTDVNNIPANN